MQNDISKQKILQFPYYCYYYSVSGKTLTRSKMKDGNADPELKVIAKSVKSEDHAKELAEKNFELAYKAAENFGRKLPYCGGIRL